MTALRVVRARRWLRGWMVGIGVAYRARRKRHGAGPLRWRYVLPLIRHVRFIVDGQHR